MFKKIIQLIRSKFVRNSKAEVGGGDVIKTLCAVKFDEKKIKQFKKSQTKRGKRMCDEIKINQLDVQKLNLQPDEVLMVTIHSGDADEGSLDQLRDQLKKVFTKNQVFLFLLRNQEDDVKFSVVKEAEIEHTESCAKCGPDGNCACGGNCTCGGTCKDNHNNEDIE